MDNLIEIKEKAKKTAAGSGCALCFFDRTAAGLRKKSARA